MSTLSGRTIANTYKDLLKIENSGDGLDATLRNVQDGSGTNTGLEISNQAVNVSGTFKLNGVTLSATASALNAITDLTAVAGLVAVSGTDLFGRTLAAGTGVSITNANGTEGNPTIALNPSGVVSGTFGPVTNIVVNSVGQVTSISVPASISVAEVKGSTFTAETVNIDSRLSVTGVTNLRGVTSITDLNSPGATFSAIVSGTAAVFSGTVSANAFVGDGSGLTNVPSAEGGTVKTITAGTGVSITVNGASAASMTVSGTVLLNANQTFGIVSATTLDADSLLVAGVAAANVTQVAAVSTLTKTNLDAIASINSVVGTGGFATTSQLAAVSATMATSIANRTSAITSVNSVITALSATMATSIGNRTSAITALSATMATSINNRTAAITSVNSVITALSATMATSIGNRTSAITALSATMATSIGTANTRITSVSDYAVALSATLATSIGNRTSAITSVNSVITALSATMATSIGNRTSAITALSATMATSINTANTRITSVSDYAVALSATMATSIGNRTSAITALSATMATSIATRLPLAGGTITGTVSAQSLYVSALGANTTATMGKRIRMDGAAVADLVSLTDGTSIDVDFNTSQNFIVQLGGNRTLAAPTNCVAGQVGSIIVIQDGTGSRTLSYASNWKFPGGTAPTLTTGAGLIDRIDYIVYTSTAVQAIATLDIK